MNDSPTPLSLPPRKKIAVIGGDLRQLEAAKEFAAMGYDCRVFGLDVVGEGYSNGISPSVTKSETLADAMRGAAVILLPLPYSHDGVTVNAPLSTQKITTASLFTLLSDKQQLAAGLLGGALPQAIPCFDYSTAEVFAIRNARATVEGALAIAIRETPITLSGSSAAIIGFGRIGKMLANALAALGAAVSVFARSAEQRAWATAEGHTAYPLTALTREANRWDILFNTVPSPVVTHEALAEMKKDAVILELASLPGGIDLHAAARCGIHVVTAPGLPGKYAPRSAGKIIAETVADAFGL